ncbi:TetR/AcrR family transcriptional regulator [Roseomonas sp. BN140053]|uniref:TetR/AcrR family transcriptional regulator n=1 Tax=Roseomonas sp. BN140053 TaxID=3391898 RepID=UPI0039EB6AB0
MLAVPEADPGSRDRLVRAAARLFAAHGFDGVSVRQVAAAAGANSALVGYYFRGKEGLLSAVYRSLSAPLTEQRLRLLEACTAGGQPPRLEAVLDAFLRPALDATVGPEGQLFTRLRAMLAGRHSRLLDTVVAESFDRSSQRFVDAIHACLPDLSRDEVYWRFHFLLGAIYYTAAGPHRVEALSGGGCDPADTAAMLPQLIRFAAAGFRAPPDGGASPLGDAASPTDGKAASPTGGDAALTVGSHAARPGAADVPPPDPTNNPEEQP